MDSRRQLLRVPRPDCQSLSFCEPSVRGVKHWLGGLPKANLGETARLLYQALQELNQLRATPQARLHLLELLRPEIHYVCRQLERYVLSQPIVLGERPRKVASLCQALQNHLASGYKLMIIELLAQPGHDRSHLQLLASTLQRAIHSLCAILVRSYQLYSPTPTGLWLELHQLYLIATEHSLQNMPVRDELAFQATELSAEQSYIVALMLGSARCNQLRRQSIATLAETLESWSSLVRLHPVIAPGSLFGVSPESDRAPRYLAQFEAAERHKLVGIDPRELVTHIQTQLELKSANPSALPGTNGLNIDLLQHVSLTWSDIPERSFQRNPGAGRLSICIGMSALHYYLAGESVFSNVLKQPDACTSAKFKLNNGAPDVWAIAFDAQTVAEDAGIPHDRIEFTPSTPSCGTSETDQAFSVFDVDLINHSPGGFCLSWSTSVPSQLQAGELLGLREANSTDWSIAVVRWIRQVRGGGLHMGVELIAPHAQPCGLKLLRNADHGSEYLRALLLPAISVISRPATLIAPRLPFQEGHKVMINQNGDEQRAALRCRQKNMGSYNQFEYQVVGLPAEQQETPITAPVTDSVVTVEDFDSLWKSL